MYAAALLLATAAVGVDTGWQPAQDDPQSVQYIIQIEPEVLQKMLRDGTPIDSIVPPDVPGGVIRCFRVQLGEDELPREMPQVAKAGYNAEIENDNATLHKMVEAEPLELNPAPDNRSAASTAAPSLDALAQGPTPRYSSALSPGGSTFPSNSAGAGTPLNPTTRTANAADGNPSLSGTGSNFSIPGGSTTTPVAPSTTGSRFAPSTPAATSTPTANSAASSTYPRSSYSNTPTSNPSSEYPQYTSPPLNTTTGNDTVPLGGSNNTSSNGNYGRFSDTYATPGSSSNYNTGGNNFSSGQSGANNGGNLTPINGPPASQNNNQQNNNNGNYTPPSNNQQQQQQPNNNNNYQQPGNNYQQPQQQQPYPQQPPAPYGQPGYVNTFQPNPYMPNMGYPPQYNPYLAALPGFGAPALTPPAQQQPAAQTPAPAAQTPAPSPSDRTARDLEEETKKPAEPVERPYWMLVIVAFLSLGFNIYMGWMVVDFRTKYRDILAGFRELKAAN